jgi:hypothetical protein
VSALLLIRYDSFIFILCLSLFIVTEVSWGLSIFIYSYHCRIAKASSVHLLRLFFFFLFMIPLPYPSHGKLRRPSSPQHTHSTRHCFFHHCRGKFGASLPFLLQGLGVLSIRPSPLRFLSLTRWVWSISFCIVSPFFTIVDVSLEHAEVSFAHPIHFLCHKAEGTFAIPTTTLSYVPYKNLITWSTIFGLTFACSNARNMFD